jgi:membrane protease YdiL (CAAX protease family)
MPSGKDPAIRTAALFTVLALGFAVLYWLATVLSRSGVLPFSMEHGDGFFRKSIPGTIVWLLFDCFGPALAAVIALAVCRGRAAVVELGRSIVRWRVPPWLYVAAWFLVVVNLAVVVAGYATHSLQYGPSGLSLGKFVLFFFAMAFFDGPLGEEIGWRGVLLPELMRKVSPLAAASIVGVVWYAWHVPLYAVEGKLRGVFEHLFFLYTCVALSIVFTWFFLKSKGSTFLMIYLHDATNFATFVRFKLFHRLAVTRGPAIAYGAALLVFAILAAIALRRAGQARADTAALQSWSSSSMARG